VIKSAARTILLLIPLCSIAGSLVDWRGYKFRDVQSISEIPRAIRDQLGATLSGLDGIADKDQPFNPTDVVDSSLPMRRFLVAGQDHDTWLVALEHGGYGYNIQVYLFVQNRQLEHWVLLASPITLQSVLELIPPSETGQ
jgi:hypothetical protein